MAITIRIAAAGIGEDTRSFDRSLIRIGRNPEADICFDDDQGEVVSWDHATIELRSAGAFLQDAKSTNGTFLNDRRVERRTQLNTTDEITLGQAGPRLRIEAINNDLPVTTAENAPAIPEPRPQVDSELASSPESVDDSRSSRQDSRLWRITRQRPDLTAIVVGLLILLAVSVTAIALNNRHTPESISGGSTNSPGANRPPVPTAPEPAAKDAPTDPAPPPQELVDIRNLLHELIEELKNKKEPLASRDRLVKYALQQRMSEKANAGSERDETALAIDRIRVINEARDYVLGSFDPRTRGHVPEFTELADRLKRLQRVQDQWTHKFVTLAKDSRGAIWSGRALNHFLDMFGGVALRHQFLRDKLGEETTELHRLLEATDLTEGDRTHLTERLNEVAVRLKLLNELKGMPVLTENDRENLNLRRGSSKEALSMDVAGKPIAMHWNVLATLPEGDFKESQDRIAPLYESFMKALKESGVPDLEIGDELLRAVDDLEEQFFDYRLRYARGDLVGVRKGVYTAQLYRAKAAIEQLRIDVVAMMTAKSADQVFLGARFDGSTVEELMAYATKNSLTFSAANQLERPTHEKVYRGFVQYYLTMHGLARAINRDKGRIAPLVEREQELMVIEYENSLKDLHGILLGAGAEHSTVFTDVLADSATNWFFGKIADEFWDWLKGS